MTSPPNSPAAFRRHDHAQCVETALAAADAACAAKGKRMTPVRRRTLEILLEAHEALGAYAVLDRLAAEGFGAQPPVAYRALGFLVDQGLAHRIARLNAYVACAHPAGDHVPAFLICRGCGTVAETESTRALAGPAREAGFLIEDSVIEAEGLCPACRGNA